MIENNNDRKKLYLVCAVGLMGALVFAMNFAEIPLSEQTRVHLGNAPCLLSGLLFGPVIGGLSSGIGAALFDLFNPLYIASAPYTFISKFAMGFTAGILNLALTKKLNPHISAIISAIAGQLVYIVLYLGKYYVSKRLIGMPADEALFTVRVKAVASLLNASFAVLIAVPLSLTLRAVLKKTAFGSLFIKSPEPSAVPAK